jgi:hypothetical protein
MKNNIKNSLYIELYNELNQNSDCNLEKLDIILNNNITEETVLSYLNRELELVL